MTHDFRDTIQFTVHDLDLPDLPRPDANLLLLPNPTYLEIHAACCKVAHMSGAAEYLDAVVRDIEGIGVLAEDGASANVLEYAILSRLIASVK